MNESTETDLTRTDYAFSPLSDGGRLGHIACWSGRKPRVGDHLILRNGERTTRYRVTSVDLCMNVDPQTMWMANLAFAPRPGPEANPMTTETGTFTPTDEDVERAASALHFLDCIDLMNAQRCTQAEHRGDAYRVEAQDVLATIGPIIERERRAAKVEALREVAMVTECDICNAYSTPQDATPERWTARHPEATFHDPNAYADEPVCPRCGSGWPCCADVSTDGFRYSHGDTCARYHWDRFVCRPCNDACERDLHADIGHVE